MPENNIRRKQYSVKPPESLHASTVQQLRHRPTTTMSSSGEEIPTVQPGEETPKLTLPTPDDEPPSSSRESDRASMMNLFRQLRVPVRVHDVIFKGNLNSRTGEFEAQVDSLRSATTIQELLQASAMVDAKLQGLEIFDSVRITLNPGGPPEPELPITVNVVVEVVEAKTPLSSHQPPEARVHLKAERGWRKGCERSILENSKYLQGSGVPPFLHEEPSQVLPRKSTGRSMRTKRSTKLVEGMRVEVMVRLYEGAQDEVWYPATLIKQLRDERFLVGYLTIRTEEGSPCQQEVGLPHIRPSPPTVFLGMPVGLEQVDGWYRGGWWVGYVSRFVPGREYWVCSRSTGLEMAFDHYKLRPHQDLDSKGNWNPAPKISSYEPEVSSGPYELKIKGLEETFTVGMMVEVRTDAEYFIGSLFPAKIVNCVGNGDYIVQYRTLKSSDGTQPLVQVIAGTRLRPCPPEIEKDDYKVLEEVDVWWRGGWWAGLISRSVGTSEYSVYFWTRNKEFRYVRDHLRPHQDWTCGKWTAAPTPKVQKLSMMPKWEFSMGMMVEVQTVAHGFVGAWYSAKILLCLALNKFIVVYETLRKEDGLGSLEHIVDGCQIRPRPPPVVDKRGCYTLLELVDAWDHGGWRVGLISRILDTSKYKLYFWTSNAEMEFHPRALRPHQDWTDGKWKTPLKMSNSLMKSKLGKLGREGGLPALGACFCNGKTVEVCSIEKGFHDAWYPAVIMRSMRDGNYLVQYITMTRDDDETQLLIQEADGSCMRPTPPFFLQKDPFKVLEQVDAWYCEGWFVGHIQKVKADSNYLVHLNTTGEVVEFQYEYLRPHQDWLNAEWKSYTKVSAGKTAAVERQLGVGELDRRF